MCNNVNFQKTALALSLHGSSAMRLKRGSKFYFRYMRQSFLTF